MNTKQSTLKEAISFSGIGLHSGYEVKMELKPAPENHGIKFQRVDLPGAPIVEADCDLVVDTSRGTTLKKGEAVVATVEHIMAALAGLEIDNCLIEINAPEIPIMDGSSQIFVESILKVGIFEQQAEREYFEVPSNIYYSEQEKGLEMIAMPVSNYRITVMVDYNSPVLGSQHASITDMDEFKTEIASARTFCFLHELDMLLANNLIKGGDLDNAIVIVDRKVDDQEAERLSKLFNKPGIKFVEQGILNNIELRYQNEPARHKLLDLVGDLALVGMPLKAQIMAARPGHAANIAFAKRIKKAILKHKKTIGVPIYDPMEPPVYDNVQIQKLLPHAHPFIYVDKVTEVTENYVIGIKNVTITEPFFQGHFPGEPVMPGVLQIEAMAQVGGILILSGLEDPKSYSTYFLKIDNVKFKDKVVPGDTLVIKMELTQPLRRGICMMKGQIFVGNKVVTEGEMMASIVKNK